MRSSGESTIGTIRLGSGDSQNSLGISPSATRSSSEFVQFGWEYSSPDRGRRAPFFWAPREGPLSARLLRRTIYEFRRRKSVRSRPASSCRVDLRRAEVVGAPQSQALRRIQIPPAAPDWSLLCR